MKYIKLLTILSISMVMLFSSCGKDDDQLDDEVGSVIKKYIFDDIQYQYFYTMDGKLAEYMVGLVGSLDNTSVKFEYDGDKLLNYTTHSGGEIIEKVVFISYYENNKPAKAEVYDGDINTPDPIGSLYFTFDGNKMTRFIITELSPGQEDIIFKSEYLYSGKNVAQQKNYTYSNNTYILSRIINFTYDSNNNPAYIFNLFNFADKELFKAMSVMDINNYTSMEISDANGYVYKRQSFHKVFEYNSEGFPTDCIMTSFDNDVQYIMKYEY